jgi:hypothetical protein
VVTSERFLKTVRSEHGTCRAKVVDERQPTASDRVRDAVADALRRVGPSESSLETIQVPVPPESPEAA